MKESNQYPEYDETMQTFYDFANAACKEIEKFRPDLILVLAHGGWGVLWAVQALWEHLHEQPLPPVLVINLGREKKNRFQKMRDNLSFVHTYPYVPDYCSTLENGFFLAWLSIQKDWQDVLRQKTLETLQGKTPDRILVLDDANVNGFTFRLTLGLISDVFPTCSTMMLSVDTFEWRDKISKNWFKFLGIERPSEKDLYTNLEIDKLTSGTEDSGGEDSMDWRLITSESEILHGLKKILPVESWLKLPDWAKKEIKSNVVEIEKRSEPLIERDHTRIETPSIDPLESEIKTIWLQEPFNLNLLTNIFDVSEDEIENLLASLISNQQLLFKARLA